MVIGRMAQLSLAAAYMSLMVKGNPEPGMTIYKDIDIDDLGLLPARPRRRSATMAEPHDHPPSPFESRQVRRARQRKLAKQA